MNRNIIIEEINIVLNLLSHPLTPEDIKAGWTQKSFQNWYRWLNRLKERLQVEAHFDYTEYNTARALGMDGIDKGILVQRISHIGNLVMRMASDVTP